MDILIKYRKGSRWPNFLENPAFHELKIINMKIGFRNQQLLSVTN